MKTFQNFLPLDKCHPRTGNVSRGMPTSRKVEEPPKIFSNAPLIRVARVRKESSRFVGHFNDVLKKCLRLSIYRLERNSRSWRFAGKPQRGRGRGSDRNVHLSKESLEID